MKCISCFWSQSFPMHRNCSCLEAGHPESNWGVRNRFQIEIPPRSSRAINNKWDWEHLSRMITCQNNAFTLQRRQRSLQISNMKYHSFLTVVQKLPTKTQQQSRPKTNLFWVDMVSGEKRKKTGAKKKYLFTMRGGSTPFSCSHAYSDMLGIPSQPGELCSWASSRPLHGQNWLVCLLRLPLEIGPSDPSSIRNRLNLLLGTTNTYT